MDNTVTIFTEALVARLLPMMNEVTLNAMRSMDKAQYQEMIPFAIVGALIAQALWFGVGIWLRRMPKKISTEAQQQRIEKMRGAATEWLPWLLIFSPMPIGPVLVMAAGFFGLRPFVAGAAILGGEVLWRIAPLL